MTGPAPAPITARDLVARLVALSDLAVECSGNAPDGAIGEGVTARDYLAEARASLEAAARVLKDISVTIEDLDDEDGDDDADPEDDAPAPADARPVPTCHDHAGDGCPCWLCLAPDPGDMASS